MPTWDPDQYGRFAAERAQPFHDLLDLVRADGAPAGVRAAVDLGCGPGELTALAASRFGATFLGVDDSPSMLGKAAEHANADVRFEHGDIAVWTSAPAYDLVLANAALQWVPDHPSVLRRWTTALLPGGQLAVQVPDNAGQPSHLVAAEVARSAAFVDEFGPAGPPADPVADNVLEPEEYATVLHELGFVEQHVRLQVYPHLLPSSRHVVEWVKGTTLTRFSSVLTPATFERFVDEYGRRLLEVIGDRSPFFFPFRRILMWGRLDAA